MGSQSQTQSCLNDFHLFILKVVCLGEAGIGAGGKTQEAGEGTREVPFLSCEIGVLILDSLRGLTEMP